MHAGRQLVAAVLTVSSMALLAQSADRGPEPVGPVQLMAGVGPLAASNTAATTHASPIEALADDVARERAAAERDAERKAEEAKEKAEEAEKKAEEEAKAPDFVKPVDGTLTSGFGARWGTMHTGVDIANSIGTPIVSVADGTVIEAGPASGFGLWVQVEHEDGTVTVYGHMNEILVTAGQQVSAGDKIATVGNRGQSTGPHLHFEVWSGGEAKIDPIAWLAERGVSV